MDPGPHPTPALLTQAPHCPDRLRNGMSHWGHGAPCGGRSGRRQIQVTESAEVSQFAPCPVGRRTCEGSNARTALPFPSVPSTSDLSFEGRNASVSHLHGEEPPLLGKRRGVSPPASDTTVSPPLPAALCAPLTCRLLLLLPCSGCSLPACRSPARCLPAFQDRHFSASALSLPSSLSRTFHS